MNKTTEVLSPRPELAQGLALVAAWVSGPIAVVALLLLLFGAPGYISLSSALTGLGAAGYAIARGLLDHVATQLGLNLGLLNLLLWPLLVVVLQGWYGVDLSELLMIPDYGPSHAP